MMVIGVPKGEARIVCKESLVAWCGQDGDEKEGA